MTVHITATVTARWYSTDSNLPVRRIVIHDEEHPFSDQSAEAVARMFATSDRKASAHYIVDGDSTIRCVPDQFVAYHAPPNTGSIGIERDGYATFTRTEWLSPYGQKAGLRQAQLVAELCVEHDIPPRRLSVEQVRQGGRGICGHVDVSLAFGKSTHTDPGVGFPWPEFMACVTDAHARITGQEDDDMTPAQAKLLEQVAADVAAIKAELFTGDAAPVGALVAETNARTARQGTDLGKIKTALKVDG
jgi:N-acetyl-anhydromuramyl-L-alanine amidase AmpD